MTRFGVMCCWGLACLTAAVVATPASLAASGSASSDTLTITPPPTPEAPISLQLSGTLADAGPDSITVYAIPGASTCDGSPSQAQRDYSLDPQGTASVSGPGPFSTTTQISVANAATYLLCGYLEASDGTAITAPAVTSTVPAACFVTPPYSVSGPSKLLATRTGLVVVNGSVATSSFGIDATAVVVNSSGTLSVPVALSPNPYTNVAEEGTFRVPALATPYHVLLSEPAVAPDGSTCTRTVSSNPITVTNAGVHAGLRIDTSNLQQDEATLEFTGNCEDITPSAATVTISGPGLAARLFISDVCRQWSDPGDTSTSLADLEADTERAWVRGRDPSVEKPAKLELRGGGSLVGSDAYTITVRYNGKIRVFTAVTTVFAPGAFVWQGTKVYSWWCVDENQPLHVEGGRSYCLASPSYITSVTG